MKCFIAIVLLALFAVAFSEEKSIEPEKLEPVPVQDAPRDKRGVFLSYASPYTYSSYVSPLAYSLPYTYRNYPYYNYYL
ncbi:uncharacterized protein LOC143149494 [Ptiloglossa arizonensis]|uniref:uncharacterized protein LOC143149494 n=1 Tax=Ptiloglossa arizonensis TaxID=3350558 RepID=UPI003FA0774C